MVVSPVQSPVKHQRTDLLRVLQQLEKKKSQDKPTPPLRIALAEAEFRLAVWPGTDLAESIERLRRAIEYDPFHPKLPLHLGHCLHKGGDYRGAVRHYQQAVTLAPGSLRSYAHLAMSLLELGKVEEGLGRDLLQAAMNRSETDIMEVMKGLDSYGDAQRTATPDKPAAEPRYRKPSKTAAEAATAPGWDGVWRLALIHELVSGSSKQVASLLMDERVTPAELAVITLLQVMEGLPDKDVEERLKDSRLAEESDHPAVQLLKATLTLRSQDDYTVFVEQATAAINNKHLPPELGYYIHYEKCGHKKSLSPLEAFELLRSYPKNIQEQPGFQDLRIAVLDGYARSFWADERFNHAKVLWGEIASLDPFNIAVEHNLALLAARTRARDLYSSAWSHAAELRYLHAAAAGDVQVLLDERKALHQVLVQQSKQRFAKDPQKLTPEEITAWVDDQEALEVWLREWNLYYINARLSFQSPVHLLGISRDADDQTLSYARDSLLQLVHRSLESCSWSGIKTFCTLAQQQIEQAAETARDPVLRTRDPYYEPESAQANELLQETVGRVLLMHQIMTHLLNCADEEGIMLGCVVGQHLLALPLRIVEQVFKDQGQLERDQDFVDIVSNLLLSLVMKDDPKSKTPAQIDARVEALDECLAFDPENKSLKMVRLQLLLLAKRNEQVYEDAAALLNALPTLESAPDPEARSQLEEQRTNLQNIIDNAALSTLSEETLNPQSLQEAEQTIEAGQAALRCFPLAQGLRKHLVDLMQQIGKSQEASELLQVGLETVTDAEERSRLEEEADQLAAAGEVETLLQEAAREVNEAYERFTQEHNQANLQTLQAAVGNAIPKVKRARQLAKDKKLDSQLKQADQLLGQYQDLQNQFKQLKKM